jgi:hypothetical protein
MDRDISTWHPDIQEIYRYWVCIHPDNGLPGCRQFDPIDLRQFLPRLWLLEVQRRPFRLRYRLAGTRICELAGRELTGLWLDESHTLIAEKPDSLDRFRHVVETSEPSWRRGTPNLFLVEKADFTETENLFMPLAQDGRTVDMILAYTIFYRLDGSEL